MPRGRRGRRVRVILEGERPWSINTIWAGVHWGRRKKYADRTKQLIAERVREMGIEPFRARVSVTVRVYFDDAPIDPDNILAKPYIDGLRLAGVLGDDTAKEISRYTTEARMSRRRPRVEIHLAEVTSKFDIDRAP